MSYGDMVEGFILIIHYPGNQPAKYSDTVPLAENHPPNGQATLLLDHKIIMYSL